MLNYAALATIVEEYKNKFPDRWSAESYKWKAVKHFQENWDINAPDFLEMFSKATEKTENLLHTGMFWPRDMMIRYIKDNSDVVRDMFKELFDESKPLSERIIDFTSNVKTLNVINDPSKKHQQTAKAISTYLWLRYPEKYYIYKYDEYSKIAHLVNYPIISKKSSEAEKIQDTINLYNELSTFLARDNSMKQIALQLITSDCYEDKNMKIWAGDLGYYINQKAITDDRVEKLENSILRKDSKMQRTKNIPLNQILYGPPGTGKTYNTIIEAMKILTFEELFKDWFLKIYCSNNKVVSQERVLGDYTTTLKKINEEFLINDNIFVYYELEQFIPLKNYILNSKYITADSTKNNKNSYYQHALKRYEEFLMWLDYDKIREKFNEYKDSGRIEFITFHQSYSYEEFVEGIKPDLDKNCNDIRYTLNDGIFKIICKNAKQIKTDKKSNKIDFTKTRIFKMSLGANWDGEDIYNYCLNNNVVALGWGGDEDFSNCNDASDFKKVDNTWGAKAVEIFKNWMRIGDIILISNGNSNIKAIAQITGNYEYHNDTEIKYCQFRNVNWLYSGEDIPVSKFYDKKLSQQAIYGFYSAKKEGQPDYNSTINTNILNEIITGNINKIEEQPYVLIIDEINRGNISKIFGELITLIEDDKRSQLTVRLPYSQKPFTVPKNLYIIGTMNTADRSIAAIDIALRRRFTFIPKMPDISLVPDLFNMKESFEKLNKKIRILLDEDHQIGHSYFMNVKSVVDLKETWANKIIPLLNEYFYGDWSKLNLLIPGFIITDKINNKEIEDEIGENCYCRFNDPFSLSDDDFIKATLGLKLETTAA